MTKRIDTFAFDRASVRETDADGRLQVAATPISKAIINPYLGSEIPGATELGLDPTKIYMLLRDPDELAKAATTFNNIPVLSRHEPFHVSDYDPAIVVGSTGTDAEFKSPYLLNSLVVWNAIAIAGIELHVQKELSCSYRYHADMTPGEFNGERYDGVMRDIIGNHVALVEQGRAGPDVFVHDSNPFLESFDMSKLSPLAIAVRGALRGHIKPLLAADGKMPDLTKIVALPKAKTIEKDAKRIASALELSLKGHLAADAKIDHAALVALVKLAADEEPEDLADDEDDQRDDESDEDYEKRTGKKGRGAAKANDKDDADEPEIDKKAMDSAIAAARKDAEDSAVKRMQAINTAQQEVRPLIGEVAAQDSAEAIYKLALDHAEIDVADVPASAYRALFLQHMKMKGAAPVAKTANDSAGDLADFKAMFPTAKIPKRG